jgi:hypothetical protein
LDTTAFFADRSSRRLASMMDSGFIFQLNKSVFKIYKDRQIESRPIFISHNFKI